MKEEILNKIYKRDKDSLLSGEELHELTEWICNKDKEIERLNNIINELENWIAKEYISGNYEELYRIGLQYSYDKLQELKRK